MLDIQELKQYILDNNLIETILLEIGCHDIKHKDGFFQCANADGDNKTAICVYEQDNLKTINFTRKMIDTDRSTDLIDLVCYTENLSFVKGLEFICDIVGLDYYHDFEEELPDSFKVIKLLKEMELGFIDEKEKPLKPIDESILKYYKPYVNDLFKEDGISYHTQQFFEIGFDTESNRYTIPIRSEKGDLVGIKGRYFYRNVPDNENKYVYLEPCAKSKIIYGLNKTMPFIKNEKCIYVLESEKAVLQLWSYGYMNAGSLGGKIPSKYQIDLLSRLGVPIILCLDKDVNKIEIEQISNLFPNGVPIYYIYDEDNILDEKESPSDSEEKWIYLVKNNIYKIK